MNPATGLQCPTCHQPGVLCASVENERHTSDEGFFADWGFHALVCRVWVQPQRNG